MGHCSGFNSWRCDDSKIGNSIRDNVDAALEFRILGFDVWRLYNIRKVNGVVHHFFGQEGRKDLLITYDNRFNANEWFIIIALCIGITCIVASPKRFTKQVATVFFMCGVYSGFFFDHSLSVEPVSFYDVNDVSRFQVWDFISYFMYGSSSYFFFYIYDQLQQKLSQILIYILAWSLFAIGLEWLAVTCGVFHYLHGYKLSYSFPIYLLVHSCWIALYHSLKRKEFVQGPLPHTNVKSYSNET